MYVNSVPQERMQGEEIDQDVMPIQSSSSLPIYCRILGMQR